MEFGIERGEVRDDIDLEMIVSMVDWLAGSLQDALVTEELDPGLFHRWQNQPERQRMRMEHFSLLLQQRDRVDQLGRTAVAAVDAASRGGGGAPRRRPPASPSAPVVAQREAVARGLGRRLVLSRSFRYQCIHSWQ